MECKGKFKFKGLDKKDGGTFKKDNGDLIEYKASYSLKVDEISGDGINERLFKLAVDSEMIPMLMGLKPYDDLTITFDVKFYASGARLTPINVELKH